MILILNRKLSIKYHPDRNPDDPEAANMFMLITKAVNCLADEKTRENCEKFGNPEGGSSFSVFFFKKKIISNDNKRLVLPCPASCSQKKIEFPFWWCFSCLF